MVYNRLVLHLSSSTSTSTTFFLLGTDFTANVIVCLRIVWLRINHPENVTQCINLIQELAVNELVEFLAPTLFLITFALFSYGPNCHLMGNLCNGYWQFVPIQDMHAAFLNLGGLCSVDLVSTLVTGIILKATCKINILMILKELLKEYKIAFCVVLGARLSMVCKISTCTFLNYQHKEFFSRK